MAVHIRLRRIGKNPKKRPHFRFTVSDEHKGRDSSYIEQLGYYSPTTGAVTINKGRFDYWLQKGAQASNTVKSLVKKFSKGA